uniref:Uncharacterized protein n=1 Tax=Timema tahoe TaxID=61484 RepID=A0A7R9II22_9NEOP|nr:unnamed protein product [Timema tahoe]
MSSSCCLAPLPSRMEALTMRLCVRAAEQYDRLLEFNKKGERGSMYCPPPLFVLLLPDNSTQERFYLVPWSLGIYDMMGLLLWGIDRKEDGIL